MPTSYFFDSRIVVVRGEGQYEPKDLKATISAALADSACPKQAVLMLDLRDSSVLVQRSTAQLEDMAMFLADQAKRFNQKLAFVVSSTTAYGLMRMGSVYAESDALTPEVFRDYDKARHWLLS